MALRHERPLLVLVGGNGSTADRFRKVLPFLEERFRPLLVELAGQGTRESAAVPGTLAGFADDLAKELQQRIGTAEGRWICYGHGVGGLVLAHALRRLSARPDRLILHAPVGAHLARRRLPWLMAWSPLRALAVRLLASPLIGPRIAARFFAPRGAVTAGDRRLFAEGYRRARSFGALFAAIDPLAALDGLQALELPVTLLWGLDDHVLHPDQLLAWAELLRCATVTARVVPGWRHYPYLDWPEAFAAVLEECAHDHLPAEPVALDSLFFYRPRTKAGRLAGMRRAGLPVPAGWWLPRAALENGSAERLFRGLAGRFAVRSSSHLEDQSGHTAAGVFDSFLDVAPRDLLEACRRVVDSGSEAYLCRVAGDEHPPVVDVIVQEMVAARAGGVAWVRGLGVDLEMTAGRIDRGVAGAVPVARASLSDLGSPWSHTPDELPGDLTERTLRRTVWPMLRRVHALLDCGTLDVEWVVGQDGSSRLLQARPVAERSGARRLLSAANLREIAPPAPSPFFISATDAGSTMVPRYYACHDAAIAAWHEPFSVSLGGRIYLNADLLAALMDRWGLPRALVSRAVGGRLPRRSLHIGRLVVALPSLWRLLRDFTTLHPGSEDVLDTLAAQLEAARDLPALAAWFERAFAALVTVNLRIGGALVVAVPFWPLRAPEVVTAAMAREFQALEAAPSVERIAAFEFRWGHRGEYETDPARPRGEETRRPGSPLALALRPRLPDPLASLPLPLRRVPMLAPRHLLAHREWFRDGAMRLWTAFRARVLFHARACVASGLFDQPEDAWQLTTAELRTLPPTSWRERIAARRGLPPTEIDADLFWSDTLAPFGAVPLGRLPLVPGTVSGPALVARTPAEALALLAALPVAGERPILIAPAVDPGWLPVFVRAGGVATELGGRLSHAATLLRELAIPSVLNLADATASARTGDRVRLRVPPGVIEIVEPRETASRHPAESGARL